MLKLWKLNALSCSYFLDIDQQSVQNMNEYSSIFNAKSTQIYVKDLIFIGTQCHNMSWTSAFFEPWI